MRIVWLILGFISLGLGALGVVLPLLPTTPFVILAAFCFARSSPRLHDWLRAHAVFGRAIDDWHRNRAISRKGKTAAVATMALLPVLSLALGVELVIVAVQALVCLGASAFILTRNTAA